MNLRNYKVLLLILSGVMFQNTKAQIPTWSENIANIVYKNCGSCHRSGSIAPFSLETYSDFTSHSGLIEEAVNSRQMPPWPPDEHYQRYAHEKILSNFEIFQINQFIDGGMPAGNLATAPTFPVFSNSSQVGTPDTVIQTMSYTVSMTTDEYRCFTYASGFNAIKKFRAIEFIPGNLQIVHHALLYYDTTGVCASLDAADPAPGYSGFGGVGTSDAQLIAAWVPGSSPVVLPDEFAYQVPANAVFVIQFHYAGGSLGMIDSSKINFFNNTSGGIVRPVYNYPVLNHISNMTNGPLIIPANTIKSFHEQYTTSGAYDLALIGVAPHMHLIGTEISAYGVTPANDTLPLISIPGWDFHWQGEYSFIHPLRLPTGTTLHSDAKYDNTPANPLNPNSPPIDVFAGEGTSDEMMITFFQFTVYLPGDEAITMDTAQLKDIATLYNQVVDVNDFNSMSITAFPNPVMDKLNISFNAVKDGNYLISVFDSQGREIRNCVLHAFFNLGKNTVQLNTSDLSSGNYILGISNSKGIQSVKKFTVTKGR